MPRPSRIPPGSRPGFTLIEALVVVSLLGILAALILPAVANARESSRRLSCVNNLKQIGVGLLAYHDVNGCFPLGRTVGTDPRYARTNPPCAGSIVDRSAFARMLPFIEQAPLFNAINQDVSIFGPENRTVGSSRVGLLCCPSDPGSQSARHAVWDANLPAGLFGPDQTLRMAFASYAGSFGSFAVNATGSGRPGCQVPPGIISEANGVITDVSPIRAESIRDGLSTTLMVTEKATSILNQYYADDSYTFDHYGWFISANLGETLVTAMYPPNLFGKVHSLVQGERLAMAAGSLHPSGLNALTADGSVRFIKETINTWPYSQITGMPQGSSYDSQGMIIGATNPGVWQALATRSGSEIIDGDAF